jgi:hypothetical protein
MRELGRLFRCYCSDNHASWSKWLPQLEEWFNTTCHESTGFAPYELHFGQRFVTKVAGIVPYPAVTGMTMSDQERLVIAGRRLRKKANQRSDRHGRQHATKTVFAIGEKVWLRSLRISKFALKEVKKFFPLFEGPFVITAIAGLNAYELADEGGKIKGVFNIVNLRRHVEPVIIN